MNSVLPSTHISPNREMDVLQPDAGEHNEKTLQESAIEFIGPCPDSALPSDSCKPPTHFEVQSFRKNTLLSNGTHADMPERVMGGVQSNSIKKCDAPHKTSRVDQEFTLNLSIKPSFAQRHPIKTAVLLFFAPLAFLIKCGISTLISPFLAFIIMCSKAAGTGEWAESILTSKFIRALWGRSLTEQFRGNRFNTDSFALIIFPGFGSIFTAGSSTLDHCLELFESDVQPGDRAIISDIVESKEKLIDNMACWMASLPVDERATVDIQEWKRLAADPSNDAWLGSLSAMLKKWYEGAPKLNDSAHIDPALASRMGNMLKIIQGHPEIFKPYLSSLGLSGLGSCHDLPVLNFVDLGLRTQAHQTVLDIQAGKKSLQDLLDMAMKRFVFEETQLALVKATKSAGSRDPVESILCIWDLIQKEALLNIPPLPYRKYGSDISPGGILSIANGVTDFVNARMQNQEAIDEFLGRDDSPTQWKEIKDHFQSDEIKNRLTNLKAQEDILIATMPKQKNGQTKAAYYESHEYTHYINKMDEILEERSKLTMAGGPVRFDASQGKWAMAA